MGTMSIILIVGSIIAACLIILGILIKKGTIHFKKRKYIKGVGSLNKDNIIKAMNESDFVSSLGARIENNSATSILFRQAKNPWGMTIATYNVIRYGGLIIFAILAIGTYFTPLGWIGLLIFGAAGALCFLLPSSQYKKIARDREHQWNQLYQFMWVIKHNLMFSNAQKVFIETSNYIRIHAPQLTELITGFNDFANHWNGRNVDEYIEETYGVFSIPKELYTIILTSEKTGQFPEQELQALRRIINNKMDRAIKDVLTNTATQATIRSTPFLLLTMAIIILVPTISSLLIAFM